MFAVTISITVLIHLYTENYFNYCINCFTWNN